MILSSYGWLPCLLTIMASLTEAHKVLLLPWAQGFNSHVLDFIRMSEILAEAGLEPHFLVGTSAIPMVEKTGRPLHVYTTAFTQDLRETCKTLYLHKSDVAGFKLMQVLREINEKNCASLMSDTALLNKLDKEEFDLIIADITEFCWSLVVNRLKINAASYSPVGGIPHTPGFFPSYPSFMPTLVSKYSSVMTFTQRLHNTMEDMFLSVLTRYIDMAPFYPIADKYNTTFDYEKFTKLVLFSRGNIALDAPHPGMPNVVDIGGALLRPSTPLPPDLEEFVKGAGDAGVVLVSFGTLVDNIPDQRADILARVFARLPQRVLWRFVRKPKGLGNNTMLSKWLPQNDLLGHAQTRLFITHCGMSSTFETASHGVPVVTIPLFADQFQNSAKMVVHAGMGKMADFHNLIEAELEETINEVLNNAKYKENAMKTAKLMLDQPIHPRKKFLFYVDHIVKTGGAKHLTQPQLYQLSHIQLNSIDAYLCIAAMLLSLLVVIYCLVRKLTKCLYKLVVYYMSKRSKKVRHLHSD